MIKNLNYYISSNIPNKKAHSVQILKMCDVLSTYFNVRLFCGYEKSNHVKKNFDLKNDFKLINIKIFKNKILSIFSKLFYLLLYKEKKNDILFTRDTHYALLGLFIYNKIYLELHQTYLNKNNLSYYFLIYLFKFQKVKIIFISNELFLIYKNKINKPKSFVIAHDSSDDNLSKDLKKLKNSKKQLSVGYCGHLYKGRGIELIIQLAEKEKKIIFNILGGFKSDKNELLRSMKIPKNINFFSHRFYKDTANFLFSNDILIAPYQKKLGKFNEIDTSKYMSPLKIFEYMSSKKAIICSNHKVLKEVLKNNVNSILCDPDNFEQWLNALKSLKSKKKRDQLSINAYKDFKENFTWEKRIEKILNYEYSKTNKI